MQNGDRELPRRCSDGPFTEPTCEFGEDASYVVVGGLDGVTIIKPPSAQKLTVLGTCISTSLGNLTFWTSPLQAVSPALKANAIALAGTPIRTP